MGFLHSCLCSEFPSPLACWRRFTNKIRSWHSPGALQVELLRPGPGQLWPPILPIPSRPHCALVSLPSFLLPDFTCQFISPGLCRVFLLQEFSAPGSLCGELPFTTLSQSLILSPHHLLHSLSILLPCFTFSEHYVVWLSTLLPQLECKLQDVRAFRVPSILHPRVQAGAEKVLKECLLHEPISQCSGLPGGKVLDLFFTRSWKLPCTPETSWSVPGQCILCFL